MIGSDNSTRDGAPPFRQGGSGHPVTRRCGFCHKSHGTAGGGMRFNAGMKDWACKACKEAIDERRGAKA